jgi:hypothetical protein
MEAAALKRRPRIVHHGDARVSMRLAGNAFVHIEGVMREANVDDWLRPLIEDVHRYTVDMQCTEVALDIRKLEYANAALWRCIVAWLKRIRDDEHARYNLRLCANVTHRWQQLGVPMLTVFGVDRLIIEERTD